MLDSKEALEEQRRMCVSLGLLDRGHQHLVKCAFEALPTKEELGPALPTSSQQKGGGAQAGTSSENDDERSLFITLLPLSASSNVHDPLMSRNAGSNENGIFDEISSN